MGARVVGIIALILLIIGGVYVYQHYKQQQSLESGATHCVGCMSKEDEAKFKLENNGDSPVAPGEHSENRAQQAANAAATPTQEPAAATPSGMAPQSSLPPGVTMPGNVQPAQSTQNQSAYAQTSFAASTPTTNAPPAYDSQSANAANGMRFGGTGGYQWYRQGNLTWRLDTASGRSCIVYATMEEWRKQIVLSNGCGRSS